MDINIESLVKLKDLANSHYENDIKIVLDPKEQQEHYLKPNSSIMFDTAEWKIPHELYSFYYELLKDESKNDAEKILSIYEKICQTYVYDDNLISYIQKIDDSIFYLPDWYGRDVDEEWEQNRELHNRRVCFELSRYLAKLINELFKDREDFNVCIFWDQNLTHYFVGLSCDDFCITLDLDDFNNIKDLTRIKTGLTAEGINILYDREENFKNALDEFNHHREESAKENVNYRINQDTDEIIYLESVLDVLKTNYNLDSQGTFEYLKEIIDNYLGTEKREKVWKVIPSNNEGETRHIRCLVITIFNKKFLIDVEQMILRPFNEQELMGYNRYFIPYDELERDEEEVYNGL